MRRSLPKVSVKRMRGDGSYSLHVNAPQFTAQQPALPDNEEEKEAEDQDNVTASQNEEPVPNIPWEIRSTPESHIDAFLDQFLPLKCIRCKVETGSTYCCNCSLHFCQHCKELTHGDFIPHLFLEWNGEIFSTEATPTRCHLQCCDEAHGNGRTLPITLIDEHGAEIASDLIVCEQCSPTNCLMSLGYFPMSEVDSVTFVSRRLLDLVDSLMFEGRLSLWKALRAIMDCGVFSEARSRKFLNLYRSFGRHATLQRYRNLLVKVTSWPESCLICPASNSMERPTIIAADGIFALRRKESAGRKQDPLPPDGILPTPFVHVDVGQGSSNNPPITEAACPNWRAGDSLQIFSRGRGSGKLDIHGFFAISCRHNHIGACADIRTPGERLIYAESCLRYYIAKQPIARNIRFVYDVACKLGIRLELLMQEFADVLDGILPAVNVFHAYGHETECEIRNSVRFVSGCGLTDGEHCERINAILRCFSSQLKEMRLDNRTFFLAHIIRRLNVFHLLQSVDWLRCRLRLCFKHTETLRSEFDRLLTLVPQASDSLALIDMGKQFLCEDRQESKHSASSLQRLRAYATERLLWIRRLRSAQGQRDCRIIVRRLDSIRSIIRRSINRLPALGRVPIREYLNPSSEVYLSVERTGSTDIDRQLRRRIVEASARSERIKEETSMLRQEIRDLQERLKLLVSGLQYARGLPAQFRVMFQNLLKEVDQVSLDEASHLSNDPIAPLSSSSSKDNSSQNWSDDGVIYE